MEDHNQNESVPRLLPRLAARPVRPASETKEAPHSQTAALFNHSGDTLSLHRSGTGPRRAGTAEMAALISTAHSPHTHVGQPLTTMRPTTLRPRNANVVNGAGGGGRDNNEKDNEKDRPCDGPGDGKSSGAGGSADNGGGGDEDDDDDDDDEEEDNRLRRGVAQGGQRGDGDYSKEDGPTTAKVAQLQIQRRLMDGQRKKKQTAGSSQNEAARNAHVIEFENWCDMTFIKDTEGHFVRLNGVVIIKEMVYDHEVTPEKVLEYFQDYLVRRPHKTKSGDIKANTRLGSEALRGSKKSLCARAEVQRDTARAGSCNSASLIERGSDDVRKAINSILSSLLSSVKKLEGDRQVDMYMDPTRGASHLDTYSMQDYIKMAIFELEDSDGYRGSQGHLCLTLSNQVLFRGDDVQCIKLCCVQSKIRPEDEGPHECLLLIFIMMDGKVRFLPIVYGTQIQVFLTYPTWKIEKLSNLPMLFPLDVCCTTLVASRLTSRIKE